jgi:deazaflavin-dependent oxidoreductase (nitroreductase family)
MSDHNTQIIEEFHANNGAVGGYFANMSLVLLTTTGAKSGEKRTTPVAYFEFDGERTIVASKGGAPEHPAWYHNLRKNPSVHVEFATKDGIEEYDAVATVMSEPARTERYARIVEVAPGFGEYEKKTDRVIPLVVLTRADS